MQNYFHLKFKNDGKFEPLTNHFITIHAGAKVAQSTDGVYPPYY